MTEQDKVTVDDIIGIVKTEEQTNSVEEVRKLRGRETMAGKRFYMDKDGDLYDKDNGLLILDFGYAYNGINCKRLIDLLNAFNDENEQLKSADTITDLETEIMTLKTTIQQLRTDNTKQKKKLNTTMKENEHIKQTIKDMIESERTELGQSVLRQLWEAIQ